MHFAHCKSQTMKLKLFNTKPRMLILLLFREMTNVHDWTVCHQFSAFFVSFFWFLWLFIASKLSVSKTVNCDRMATYPQGVENNHRRLMETCDWNLDKSDGFRVVIFQQKKGNWMKNVDRPNLLAQNIDWNSCKWACSCDTHPGLVCPICIVYRTLLFNAPCRYETGI